MPDMNMCKGDDCPRKETCYRYNAIPTPQHQAYFMETPLIIESGECDYYWGDDKEMETNDIT